MPPSSSEPTAQIVASDRPDTLTCDELDVSRVERKGHLDLAVSNEMEDGCTYTWTPAGATRSIGQRLAAFGRRLSASTISMIRARR